MGDISTFPSSEAALRDVYITADLAQRSSAAPDHRGEKDALQELVACMTDDPAAILPKLVEVAMRVTGGTSSGLSLFDGAGARDDGVDSGGVFRWHNLHGTLSPFEGALTPRDNSPCGVALDQNAPVLASHPENIYDWIAAENLIIPEVLLVPLHINADEPLGTLWIVAPIEGYFTPEHARVAGELAKFAGVALRMARGEGRLRSELEEQQLLAKEMSHRLKNLFAITDGMIHGSARSAGTIDDMASALSGRLHALARAHALIQRDVMVLSAARRATLGDLVAVIVEAHDDVDQSRFTLDGPAIECGDHAINAIALVLHELTTNAVKYGALSVRAGRVAIQWRSEAGRTLLDWRESGGPTLAKPPTRTGFGSNLVMRTIERQLGGAVHFDWRADGLAVSIEIPMDQLAR